MVSIRRRRLRASPRPPTGSDGTQPRSVREPTKVRNIHDLSGKEGVVLSVEMPFADHEPKETNARRSEVLVTPTCPVPETARRTPLDQMEARVMSMTSILARSWPAVKKKSAEKKSHSSAKPGLEARKKFSKSRVGGGVSVSSIIKDQGLSGRYYLMALRDKLEEEHGVREGAKQCALMTSLHRKVPWHCPLMAMEGHKLCEHHFEKAEVIKLRARVKK